MTAWHVDEQGRKWRPFSLYTCPNHPDGPPTLPADGWEREELTIDKAYEPDELADLRLAIVFARLRDPELAGRVEQMFGLCCLGHRWKVAGFKQTTPSEETVSMFAELLRSMQPVYSSPSVLLKALTVEVEVQQGTPLPVRIPLVSGEDPDG